MSNDLFLFDKRTNCYSAMCTLKVHNYLYLLERAYAKKGGIKNQRTALKTKAALRIREQMVSDIRHGAILPPIVIGVLLDVEQFTQINSLKNYSDIVAFVSGLNQDSLSIIDGMQRTTALYEASQLDDLTENDIRVEFWFSKDIYNFIYRMLVLNTGQVPWDVKRQLETIHDPLLLKISSSIPGFTILKSDANERRSDAAEHQASKIIEMFFCFSTRKLNNDIKEQVAADFARLDIMDATSVSENSEYFVSALRIFKSVDESFSKGGYSSNGKFTSGKMIFSSLPACIGFITAVSQCFWGRPGFDKPISEVEENVKKLTVNIDNFANIFISKSPDEINEFLCLDLLNERISRKSGKVGEFEREFFFKSFKALLEEAPNIPNMDSCWRQF